MPAPENGRRASEGRNKRVEETARLAAAPTQPPEATAAPERARAYLFTFDSGFRLIYRNSAGPITEYEREALARVGRTDVAIVAYAGQFVAASQIAVTLPLIELYDPDERERRGERASMNPRGLRRG